MEARLSERRCQACIGKGRRQLGCLWFDGISLYDPAMLLADVLDRSLQQGNGHAHATEFPVREETRDGPYRLIIERLQHPGAARVNRL